jgi:hypothetical protein
MTKSRNGEFMKNLNHILLISSLLFAAPVWSEEAGPQDEVIITQAWEEVGREQSRLEKNVDKLLGGPKRLHERLVKILNEPAGDNMTRWEKEMAKLKIKLPIKVDADLGDYFNALVGVERRVEPTNVAGEQRLTDVYRLQVRVGAGFRVQTGVRVNFIRIFRGPDAKKNALFAKFYGLNRIPRKASDVLTKPNKEETKLNNEETVRIEFDGDTGFGVGGSEKEGRVKTTAGASLTTGATFIAEIYKHNEKQIQTRFMGLRSMVKGDVTLGRLTSVVGSFLPGKLGRLLSIGPTFKIGGGLNAESLMVIYRFNLASPEAMVALDEIFDGIKRVRFIKLFNPKRNGTELAKDLLEEAELAEKYALEYDKAKTESQQTGKPVEIEAKVEHLFRGRMVTNFYDINPGFGFSLLGRVGSSSGGATTFVRRFNSDNKQEFFLLENFSQVTEKEAFEGEFYKKSTSEIDYLAEAFENEKPGKLLSIVSRNELQESRFDAQDLAEMKVETRRALPEIMAKDPAVEAFFPMTKQHSGTWTLQVTLTPEALKTVGERMVKDHAAQSLYEFLDKHPEQNQMNLQSSNSNSDVGGIGLGTEAQQLAYELYGFLNETDDNRQASQFNRMKGNVLYQKYILGQFLPKLIPDDKAEELVHVKLGFSSDESGLKELPMGSGEPSNILTAVKYMRRVLNDRNLNMRMEEISTNEQK